MWSPVRPAVLLLACLALAGCADGPAASAGSPTTSAAPAPVAPAAADLVQRPARHEVSCLDPAGPVPAWFLERALAHVAARVENAVTGPMEPAVFHLRSTGADSDAPEAEIATVELLAVPTAPRLPPLSNDPSDSRTLAAYREKRTQWEAGVEAGRTVARTYAARVRELELPAGPAGTDVLGCVLHAPDLLGGSGERHLFVASSLTATDPRQDDGPAPVTLAGVQVTVAYYCADVGVACSERVGAFVDVLERAGTRDVTVVSL